MRTLTHWTDADEIIKSGYGEITYREWCEKERDRINRNVVGKVKIVDNGRGSIALARKKSNEV